MPFKKTISVVIFTFVCEKRKLISRDQNVGTFRLMVNLGGGEGGGGWINAQKLG